MSLHPSAAFQPIEAASERRGIDHDQLRESLLRDALVIREDGQGSALNQIQREIPRALLKVPPVETSCVEETKPQMLNRFHAGRLSFCVSGERCSPSPRLMPGAHLLLDCPVHGVYRGLNSRNGIAGQLLGSGLLKTCDERAASGDELFTQGDQLLGIGHDLAQGLL